MDKISFNLSLFSYLMASLGYFVYLAYRRPLVSTLAGWAVAFGLVCHTVTIGIRSSQTGHGPYTTSFEVALFLSWLIVVVYILTEWKYKIKDLGAFVIPLVFVVLLFSAFLQILGLSVVTFLHKNILFLDAQIRAQTEAGRRVLRMRCCRCLHVAQREVSPLLLRGGG